MLRRKPILPLSSSVWIYIILLANEPFFSHGAIFDQEFVAAKNFIDKTSLLKEFFTFNASRKFITAPPGFGKTTNLKMIEKFSQIAHDDKGELLPDNPATRELFKSLEIGQDKPIMTQHLAQHPVIFFDMAFQIDGVITKDKILQAYRAQFNKTCSRYKWIVDEHGTDLNIQFLKAEQHIVTKSTTGVLEEYEITEGFLLLANLLHVYFNRTVVLLIDNYDSIIHDSFIESKGCLDPVFSVFEELLFKTFQHDNKQIIEFTIVTSTTTIGFECFALNRYLEQYFFYDNHKLANYFGLRETEVEPLSQKYNEDNNVISTIEKYCAGYQIKNTNYSLFNTSCVMEYLETNDNSTWISQQTPKGTSKFLWKLLQIPEHLEQVSRLIKISSIRHGRHDFISFTNFTKIVLDDFNETRFFSGANSSTYSYMIQIGFLTPVPGRNNYIIPNLRIRNQFMADLFYYYEKVAKIDLKTIGIRLGEFFVSDKAFEVPRANLMECLTSAFAGLQPLYGPFKRNSTNRTIISSEFIYQSIIHLGGLTNSLINVIEDFPQPVSYEKTAINVIRRCVTCIEKDGVALLIKTSDQYDLEALMYNGHKYDIEKRDDLDMVVYLAIRIEQDKRVLVDVMTTKFTDEKTGNTTYHYITSYTRKVRPTKPKKNRTRKFTRTTSDWD